MFRTFLILTFSALLLSSVHSQTTRFESELIGLMPQAVTSFGAASDGHWLYVLGGAVGRPHHYDRDSQSKNFARMNLNDSSDWQLLPRTTALQSVALIHHKGSLYRIGGMRSLNAPGEDQNNISVKEFEKFSPTTMKWSSMPALPRGRSSHDAVVVGSKIYVAGGWTLAGDPDESEWLDNVICFDLENPEAGWQELCKAPFRRRAVAVASAGGKLFILGGITEEGDTSNSVDIFDLKTSAWSKGPDYPAHGLKGFGMSAFASGDNVVASNADGAIRLLKPGADSWEDSGRHHFGRFFHRLVADHKGGFLVAGGSGKGGRIRHVERFTAAKKDQAAPAVATFTIPYSGRAKNRQGLLVDGNHLYLFGGNDSLGQHDFDKENFVDESWRLDLANMTLQKVGIFPAERQSMMTALEKKRRKNVGWSFGGFGFKEGGATTVAGLHRFDFKRRQWKEYSGEIPNRSQAGLSLREDGLWIFGGLDYDPARKKNERFDHVEEVVRVSVSEDDTLTSETPTKLPRKRRAFGGVELNNHFIMVGGMTDNFKAVDTCDAFNFETGEWSQIPSPKYTRLNPQLVALDGYLYLAGGTAKIDGERQAVQEIERFDPRTQKWTVVLESSPIPTRHMRMVNFQGSLLMISTHNEEGTLRLALVRFPPERQSPSSRPTMQD